jgi:hypothetical protein
MRRHMKHTGAAEEGSDIECDCPYSPNLLRCRLGRQSKYLPMSFVSDLNTAGSPS